MIKPFAVMLRCAVAALATGSAAWGQEAARVVYDWEHFAPFAPRTALDMVERVPGFVIDAGEERRGFAGAQGNVLIDGELPASKAQEIEDVLASIPAADVLEVQLIRGSSAGSSHTLRVNVVRRASRGDGVWTLGGVHARDGRVSPSAEAAFTGRRGDVAYGVSGALDVTHLPLRGARRDLDAAGTLDETHVEALATDEREARLAAEASLPALGGELAINAQLSRIELDERLASAQFEGGGASAGSELGDLEERETVGELGALLRQRLGAWRLDWTALITRRRFDAAEANAEYEANGAFDESAQQTQRIDSGETILRGLGRRGLGEKWRLELGAEAAFNTLEQRLSLIEDDGGGPVPVILPSANVLVEEARVEASVMLVGEPAPRWTLEAGVAAEASRLTQSGDVDLETELAYFKPTLQIARAFGESNQLRLRLYRDVGQLDFEDFVAAADIQNAEVSAGNPDLRPETSWRLEAAGDWRFGEKGALALMLYHWAIEDALDIVPVGPPGDRLDAPGNIGDATLWGASAQLTLPLPLDAELRVEALVQRTEATDPLTGETRPISEADESVLNVELRQDTATFAWGVAYEREVEAPAFRLDRIEEEQDAEELTLWLETTALRGLKLRAWASNLSDSAERRERRLFDPDRLGVFDGSDVRERAAGVSVGISASGRF